MSPRFIVRPTPADTVLESTPRLEWEVYDTVARRVITRWYKEQYANSSAARWNDRYSIPLFGRYRTK